MLGSSRKHGLDRPTTAHHAVHVRTVELSSNGRIKTTATKPYPLAPKTTRAAVLPYPNDLHFLSDTTVEFNSEDQGIPLPRPYVRKLKRVRVQKKSMVSVSTHSFSMVFSD